jgi:hypothetical protein
LANHNDCKNVQGETGNLAQAGLISSNATFFVSPCRREMHTDDLGREMHTNDLGREWFLPDFFEWYGAGFARRFSREYR